MRIPKLGARGRDERGQSMVEYVLIVVLVVVVSLGVLKVFGKQIKGLFTKANAEIAQQTGGK